MSFKVAFIGAGSIGFTRGLLADLLTVPEFHDIEISFMDINPDNLRMVTQLYGAASALFGSHGAVSMWMKKRQDGNSDRDDSDE